MSATTKTPSGVSPEEAQRRIAEYRRLGYQRQAPAHIVYHGERVFCPWAGCDCQIEAINFQLDRQGDEADRSRWLAAWWNGAGLVARCPSCGRHVLFGLESKRAVEDPAEWDTALLPEDWAQRAHLVHRQK